MELMFLKELMLWKQANQNSVILVTIGIFETMGLGFNHMYVIDVMIYWWCLRTLETILKIENPNYSFIITGTNKSEAIKLLEGKFLCYKFFRNSNITKKKWKIIN